MLAAVIAAIGAALVYAAMAQQNFPTKALRLPYAPGAITDAAVRLIADRMSTVLGRQIYVENRSGAGTWIGVQAAASAEPDGYTLLYVNSIIHGSMPVMSKSLPFDSIKGFTPMAPLFWYVKHSCLQPLGAGSHHFRVH